MVSLKFLLATLPFALQALALPGSVATLEDRMVCNPPTNCRTLGNCEYCCAATPNSPDCHGAHGSTRCGTGELAYHCDLDH
jgi:hypothetical protein